MDSVMAKHGWRGDEENDADDTPYWEAHWELMDLAELHWERPVLQVLASA